MGWVVPHRSGGKAKATGEKEMGMVLWGQLRRSMKQEFGERCWRWVVWEEEDHKRRPPPGGWGWGKGAFGQGGDFGVSLV